MLGGDIKQVKRPVPDPHWATETVRRFHAKQRHKAAVEACKHLEDEPEYPEEDRYAERREYSPRGRSG